MRIEEWIFCMFCIVIICYCFFCVVYQGCKCVGCVFVPMIVNAGLSEFCLIYSFI